MRAADVEQPGRVGELQQPGGVGLADVQLAGQPLLVAHPDPAAAQQPGRLLLEDAEQLADLADALQGRAGRAPVDRALLVRGDGGLGPQPGRAEGAVAAQVQADLAGQLDVERVDAGEQAAR